MHYYDSTATVRFLLVFPLYTLLFKDLQFAASWSCAYKILLNGLRGWGWGLGREEGCSCRHVQGLSLAQTQAHRMTLAKLFGLLELQSIQMEKGLKKREASEMREIQV